MSTFSNSIQLIGHLGKDVEIRTLDNGTKIGKCSLATNEYSKTANGDRQEKTLWHRLVAWGPIAERMQLVLKKGSFVAVKGKLTYSEFEGSDGLKKNMTEIQVNEFHKLDKTEKPQEVKAV